MADTPVAARTQLTRFFLSAVLFSLFPSLFFSSHVCAQQTGKPKGNIASSVYDFGTVIQGTKVVHDFVIRSEGDMDLVVQRLVPGCGCTAATISSDPIKPGTEGKIHVEFDTSGFSGEKLKTVRVYTNDYDEPSQLLTIKGIVQPDVTIEPMTLSYEDVVRGSPVEKTTKTVEVKVREGASVKILGIKSYSRYLQVTENESSDKVRKFSVSIDPSAPVGELRDRIVILLSGYKEGSSINLPVYALVKGQLSAEPPQLSFGIVEGREPIVRSLKFTNAGTEAVRIKEVRSNHPAVSASVKEIEAGRNYVIRVTVDPQKVQRELKSSIEVITTNKEEESVAVSVYGILPPKTGN